MLHTCRICHRLENEPRSSSYPMIRYGVRSWAHADCGMNKHGMHFLQGLSTGQVERFPFMACLMAGLPQAIPVELRRRAFMNPQAQAANRTPNRGESNQEVSR